MTRFLRVCVNPDCVKSLYPLTAVRHHWLCCCGTKTSLVSSASCGVQLNMNITRQDDIYALCVCVCVHYLLLVSLCQFPRRCRCWRRSASCNEIQAGGPAGSKRTETCSLSLTASILHSLKKHTQAAQIQMSTEPFMLGSERPQWHTMLLTVKHMKWTVRHT